MGQVRLANGLIDSLQTVIRYPHPCATRYGTDSADFTNLIAGYSSSNRVPDAPLIRREYLVRLSFLFREPE